MRTIQRQDKRKRTTVITITNNSYRLRFLIIIEATLITNALTTGSEVVRFFVTITVKNSPLTKEL